MLKARLREMVVPASRGEWVYCLMVVPLGAVFVAAAFGVVDSSDVLMASGLLAAEDAVKGAYADFVVAFTVFMITMFAMGLYMGVSFGSRWMRPVRDAAKARRAAASGDEGGK